MKSDRKMFFFSLVLAVVAAAAVFAPAAAQSGNTVTAYDLIAMVNGIRTGNGLPALEVSPILMGTAQSTAEIMAANELTWHIGDVRGRVMAAGYGGGAAAWATENFAIGPLSIQDIAWIWSDADHMIPMVKPAYQHIGAGVATAADGSVYYIVQAAYTSGSPLAKTQFPGSSGNNPTAPPAQFNIPVTVATPNSDGAVIHEVKMGQSLWSIAIAYKTHIVDILRTYNLSPEQQVVWIGQKLTIPVTPSPVAPTAPAEPDQTLTQTTPGATATIRTAAPIFILPASRPAAALTPTRTATPAPENAPPTDNSGMIGVVLGGMFTTGVLLIGLGLVAKRRRS
jgi:LysM repeat protein